MKLQHVRQRPRRIQITFHISSHCEYRSFCSMTVPALKSRNQHRDQIIEESIKREKVKMRTSATTTMSGSGDFSMYRSKIFACNTTNQIRSILNYASGCDITVHTTAIQQSGRLRDIHYRQEIMALIRSRNMTPNIVTYSTLCHALKINSRIDLFDGYLDEMINVDGIEPNIILATTLLSGCVRQGNVKRAKVIWKDIILKYKLRPNILTLDLMIEILGQNGDLKRAKAIYDKMQSDPDVIALNAEYASSSKLESDPTLMIKTHSVMMAAFSKNNQIDDALTIKQHIESLGHTLSPTAYISLITFYVKPSEHRDPQRALELINECIARNAMNTISEALIHLKCIAFHHLMAEEKDAIKRKEYFEIVCSEPQQRIDNGHCEWTQKVANNVFDSHLTFYHHDFNNLEVIRCFDRIGYHLGYWSMTFGEHKKEKWVLDVHGWSYVSADFLLHHLLTKKTDELVQNMGVRWEIICGKQSTTEPSSKKAQIGLNAFIRQKLKDVYNIRSHPSSTNQGKLVLSNGDIKIFLRRTGKRI